MLVSGSPATDANDVGMDGPTCNSFGGLVGGDLPAWTVVAGDEKMLV